MSSERGLVDGRPDARRSPRRQVQLDALIRVGSTRPVPVRVQNISASGVLVQSDGASFKSGEVVDFSLQYLRSGKSVELHLSATVVRSESGDVALRFGRYDSVAYTELIELIYGAGRST